jgi:spore coat polysaccharide biosynthesis predicted glycosyltransferase SpsG
MVVEAEEMQLRKNRILISFGNNEKGKSLLRLANSFTKKKKQFWISSPYISLSDELHTFNMEDKEK